MVTLRAPLDTVEAGSTWVGIGSFTDPDSSAWSYTVDYGDGTGPQPLALTADQIKLEHVFGTAGDYTVVLTVTDDKGGSGSAKVTVHVTNAAPEVALKAPVAMAAVGEPVTLTGSFTDPGRGDTHTATWSIGGRQVAGALAEHNGKGTVSLPQVFTKPGLYPISVTVADNRGGRTTADTAKGTKAYVLVYDRNASLVGAGTVAAPAGVCTVNAGCAKDGTASFSLTVRYPRKGEAPSGEVSYTAPGFTLRGGDVKVLSAAGGTATLRGEATVNDSMKVTYEITAADAGTPADRTDQLHLKVWNSKEELIYNTTGKPSPVNGVIRISG
ncbi:PKD domain-containing protein [Microbispora siamensis]